MSTQPPSEALKSGLPVAVYATVRLSQIMQENQPIRKPEDNLSGQVEFVLDLTATVFRGRAES